MLLVGAAIIFALLQLFKPEPEAVPETESLPLVETIRIERFSGPLQVVGEGIVRPRQIVSLSPQLSGKIIFKSPKLKPGGRFIKGDVLVKADARDFESEANRIRGNIKATQAQLTYSKQQVERLADLQLNNAESKSRLDEQIANNGNLEGQLIALKAQLQRSLLDVERTEIRAPFDGAVFTEEVDVGDIMRPGQAIAEVYSQDTYEITVALDDLEAGLIPNLWHFDSKDEKIRAQVESKFGDEMYRWKGYVDAVETALDRTARTVNVIVLVENPRETGQSSGDSSYVSAPPLLPGMYASVSIDGFQPKSSAIIPADALHEDNRVWWISEQGVLEIEEVKILQAYGNSLVVQSPILDTITELITSKLPSPIEGMSLGKFVRSDSAGQN